MTTLWLDFAGFGYSATEALSFGRNAELALDEDNQFMHRITGEFRWNGLVWWLHNVGTSTQLLIFGTNGARIELPPGTEGALPMPAGSVSFVAGPTPYQLLYRADEPVLSTRTPDAPGDATVEFGTALTDRETIYLTTFALSRLRDLERFGEDGRQHTAASQGPHETSWCAKHRNARRPDESPAGPWPHRPVHAAHHRRDSPQRPASLTPT
jgi:hypothetical protein